MPADASPHQTPHAPLPTPLSLVFARPGWVAALAWLALATLASSSTPTRAAEPVFTFTELTDGDLQHIDLHDGRIDDWIEVVGEPVLRGRDAYRLIPNSAIRDYDPSDYDFRIWLAWHDSSNRIYIALESLDDEYVITHNLQGTKVFWDSVVRLLIDGDRSGGAFCLSEYGGGIWDPHAAQLEVGSQQMYTAHSEAHDSGPRVDLARVTHVPIDWPLQPPYSDSGGRTFGLDPVFSVVEFYVTPFDHLDIDSPENSRATDLYPGRSIGFAIRIYDQDEADSGGYGFDETPTSEHHIALLPHGIMAGKPQASSGLNGLAESSWAAVKHTATDDSTASALDD